MDQNLKSECVALLLEEYEVIKAIYPDFILNASISPQNTVNAINLQISIDLSGSTVVHIVPDNSDTYAPAVNLPVQYLPPILLDITLPSHYPLSKPPSILHISTGSSWFGEVDALKSTLLDFWKPRETVLYPWIELIRRGQFLWDPPTEQESIKLHYNPPARLAELLLSYDTEENHRFFLQGTYFCDVCLENHKGNHCVRLSCSHTFCKECIAEFWTSAIREGELAKLTCIDPGCMKNKKVATEAEIKSVISEKAFCRWKWLKEKPEFEQDKDHAYCPVCESPAMPSPDHDTSQKDEAWSRYKECPNCNFTFCRVCRCVWHGAHFDCPIPVQTLTRYIKAIADNTDTAWVESLERMYTTGVLRRQVTRFQDEAKKRREVQAPKVVTGALGPSEEWLAKWTQCCPGCGAYIQRTEGCNLMVCSLCNQRFCYGCGKFFTQHYNSVCPG